MTISTSGGRTAAARSRLTTGLARLTRFQRWAVCLTAALTIPGAVNAAHSMYAIAGGYQGSNPLAAICTFTLLAAYSLLAWTALVRYERPCPDAVGWALWWTVAVVAGITACLNAFAAPSGHYIDARPLALLASAGWVMWQAIPLGGPTRPGGSAPHTAKPAAGDGQPPARVPHTAGGMRSRPAGRAVSPAHQPAVPAKTHAKHIR